MIGTYRPLSTGNGFAQLSHHRFETVQLIIEQMIHHISHLRSRSPLEQTIATRFCYVIHEWICSKHRIVGQKMLQMHVHDIQRRKRPAAFLLAGRLIS